MQIEFRKPKLADADLYFKWTNDEAVRQNSFEQEPVPYSDHVEWFKQKLNSPNCFMYLFTLQNEAIGQVRIENKAEETIIGISIDAHHRGKGFGTSMIEMACADHFKKVHTQQINAYIKESNESSMRIFKKAGFKNEEHMMVKGIKSIKLSKTRRHGL
ncbi:MAG: GNAT family N-acetyltransferase [Sphingobacteriaceae bacterium]|nr:GNAT family N-acetyltransferase [Sphingobacteriaceae bacterium]MBK7816796.1 GNAT family N-acetyltransferase [Sphingobacteriaceae bacterium]